MTPTVLCHVIIMSTGTTEVQ